MQLSSIVDIETFIVMAVSVCAIAYIIVEIIKILV